MTSQRGLAATLTVAMAVSTFMQFALGSLGPFITEDLDISRAELGALTTTLFIVGGALSPISGPLVDRLGGRRALVTLSVAAGTSALLAASAATYVALALAIGVAGVGLSLGNTSTNKLLAQHVDAFRQGVVTGIKQSGVQIGAFLAGAVLPRVAGTFGWRTAMRLSAMIAAACVIAALSVVPGHERPAAHDRAPHGRLGTAVNRLALYALLMGAGVGAIGAHLPLYAVERLGLDKSDAGLVAGVIGLVGVAARVLLGRAADRSHVPVTVTLAWLAVASVGATALLLLAASAGAWLLWVGAVAFGATAIAWNAPGMLSIVRGVDARLSGRASGRVLLGFFSGFVISPVSFGWSVDRTGSYTIGLLGVAGCFVLAAVVAVSWHRAVPARSPVPAPAP